MQVANIHEAFRFIYAAGVTEMSVAKAEIAEKMTRLLHISHGR